jgi:hypothetical protein
MIRNGGDICSVPRPREWSIGIVPAEIADRQSESKHLLLKSQTTWKDSD